MFGLLFRVAHAVCQISALFGDFLQLFALHTDFLLPLLQLIGTRQNARRSAGRAARHGAARVDELSIARDNAEAVAVLSGNCQRTVHILRHNGSAEGIVHDVAVIRFTFDQIRRHAAKARLMFQAGFAQRLRTNRIHWQKGRAAAVTALEHLNGFFAIFRALDNDIGSSRTQCRFHRGDIAIRHMNERGQRPAHALEGAAGRLIHNQLDSARKSFIVALQLGQHPHTVFAVCQLGFELLVRIAGGVQRQARLLCGIMTCFML